MRFIDGTHLLVTFRGTSVLAEIFLISRDALSVVIRFDGVLGPYHHLMPLMWDGDGYRDILEGIYVGILSLVELSPSRSLEIPRIWTHQQISHLEATSATQNGTLI